MSGIARRLRAGFIAGHAGTLAGVAVASLAALSAIGLGAASTAIAAAAPPTITSAFTPNLIGVGDSDASALSFTITNPTASGTLSAVAFTDTLPAGLTVDDPNGENGTCGTGSTVTADPGSATISLTGGSVKAGAPCTVSVSVIASQTGTLTNSTGVVGSSAGASSAGDAETLTVLPPPTVSVRGIKNNARYTFGRSVRPRYSCTQPGDPAALADCSAADDLGDNVASGGALDTSAPGSHNLTVSATSSDGLVTTDTIDYTVLPDNHFTIANVKPGRNGSLVFRLSLPGAGRVRVVELAGKTRFGADTTRVNAKRTLKLTVKAGARGASLLTARGAAKPSVTVTLEVTYTPKGGVKRTVTRHGIVLT